MNLSAQFYLAIVAESTTSVAELYLASYPGCEADCPRGIIWLYCNFKQEELAKCTEHSPSVEA